MILGDNGNIFRLVGVGTGAVLTFNYDNGYRRREIVRARGAAARLHAGRAGLHDRCSAPAMRSTSARPTRSTASRGDDFIYGMVGNDVLFGDGQDDDLIGGYGHDWISGGTGEDGVLGDDGRIFTSRNGTAEPLYGIAATDADASISTPGNVQQADDQRHRRS